MNLTTIFFAHSATQFFTVAMSYSSADYVKHWLNPKVNIFSATLNLGNRFFDERLNHHHQQRYKQNRLLILPVSVNELQIFAYIKLVALLGEEKKKSKKYPLFSIFDG